MKLLFVARTFKFVSGLEGKIEFLPKIEDAGSTTNEPGESSVGNMTENVDGESAQGNVTEGDGECSAITVLPLEFLLETGSSP